MSITFNSYEDFINQLFTFQNIKYKEFHSHLILSNCLIGIPTPTLRKIAHTIRKNNYKLFLEEIPLQYYEEKIIYGFVISEKLTFSDTISYLNKLLPKMDNWAVTDLIASSLKIFKTEQGWQKIQEYFHDQNPFVIRFAFVLTLNYHLQTEKLPYILKEIENTDLSQYYIFMACAWLLATLYSNNKRIVLSFLKTAPIDLKKKTIQKICDSKKITKEEKEQLKCTI